MTKCLYKNVQDFENRIHLAGEGVELFHNWKFQENCDYCINKITFLYSML